MKTAWLPPPSSHGAFFGCFLGFRGLGLKVQGLRVGVAGVAVEGLNP